MLTGSEVRRSPAQDLNGSPRIPRETVFTSDQTASDMENLTGTLGEGLGVDALAGRLTLTANLQCFPGMGMLVCSSIRMG